MAYVAANAGSADIFLEPFPPTGAKWRVSPSGGQGAPQWRGDGKELYFASKRKLVAVTIKTEPELEISAPVELFAITNPGFNVSPDGQTFYVFKSDSAQALPVHVTLGWNPRGK